MLAPNTLLQNRYLIIRSIGHGGMGAVYLARDQRLGHTVALKETFFTEDRMRKAFEREARLLAHLRHPALPKVTDHFDEDGGQFIVMEFISGDDLEILLAQRGDPFPVEQVLGWADELLKALDYLHHQDPPILHRDIKPANLKLTPQGEIILLDFGLAKGTAGQTSSVMTSRSVFGFTPNFAPLEQIQGTGTGPRSDLYSLAATVYYLITGVIPPDALTRITEAANGQADPLRPADEINPHISSAVAELLTRTMAHNRDQRPASAAEMRELLREVSPVLTVGSDGVVRTTDRESRKPDSEANTVLPSTVIEGAKTAEIAAGIETAPSPTLAPPTANQPVSLLATAPVEETTLAARSGPKKVTHLQWALAGVAAVMLVAITVALVSRFGSNKASDAGKTAQSVTNEGALSAAPATSVSEQATTAPDNSEIITSTDLYGVKTETRTFKSHARVARVVLTTAEGRQVAEVLSHAGEARELPQEKVVTALDATGDSLADAVGFAGSPVEESKGGLAAQTENRKSSPAVKGPVRKNTVGTKPYDASVSGPNQTSTPLGGTQSTEQKTTQTADNPKERFVKGIQKTSNTQPRAKF